MNKALQTSRPGEILLGQPQLDLILNAHGTVGVSTGGRIKGVKGSYMVFCEKGEKGGVSNIKVMRVGDKISPNEFYRLKAGMLVKVK